MLVGVGFGPFAVCAAVSFFLVVGVRLVLGAFLRLGFGLLRVWWFRLVFLCSAPRVDRPMPKLGSLRSKLSVSK